MLCSICQPYITNKASIIQMMMMYLSSMLPEVCFKCVHNLNCFCWCLHYLQKYKLQAQKMINKYHNNDETGSCESFFELGNKTWLWQHHLVNWNTLTRGNNILIILIFCIFALEHQGHLWIAPKIYAENFLIVMCQSPGKQTHFGKCLQDSKDKMIESLVPA